MNAASLATLLVLLSAGAALGQSEDDMARRRAFAAKPIAEIPASVTVTRGKLALFATAGEGGQATIYVINDTAEPANFSGEDGNLYVKREAFVEMDGWHRVQSHWYSDCGNSYGGTTLPAGSFFVRSAMLEDAADQPLMKVRFRIYDGEHEAAVSNVLSAHVDPFWFEWCTKDQMALHTANVNVIADVALHGVPALPERLQKGLGGRDKEMFTPEGMMWIRVDAMMALQRQPDWRALKALEKIVDQEPPNSKLWIVAVDSISEIRRESFDNWTAWLMAPEQQKRPELLDLSLFRMGCAVGTYPRRWPEKFDRWLGEVLKDPSRIYWAYAVPVFAAGEPRAEKIKTLTQMWREAGEGAHKEVILDAIRHVTPHRVLGINGSLNDRHQLVATITNIGGLPIDFETQHPLDAVSVSIADEKTGKAAPLREDKLREQMAGKPKRRIHLEPDEEVSLGPVDIEPLFDLSILGDVTCAFRVRSKLPQFGELPAKSGSSCIVRVRDGHFAPY